jgi:hypothetical protein
MKKQTRKSIVKKLDKIFSEYIRLRDNNTCFICGKQDPSIMTNGHLFSRIAYSTRWSEINCHCQCHGCNFLHESDFEPYRKKFVDKYGQEKYDNLYRLHKTPVKYSNNELLVLIEYYKQDLKKLEVNNDKRNNGAI